MGYGIPNMETSDYPPHTQRRPFVFFALVLLLSSPFYLLNLFSIPTPLGLPPSFVMIIVPAIVALWLNHSEKHSAVGLIQPFCPQCNSLLGLSLAVGLIPALMLGMVCVSHNTEGTTAVVSSTAGFGLVAALLQYFVGTIPEEIGWTSYATKPLQDRFGLLTSGLLIGLVWEIWHIIPFWQQGHTLSWIVPHVFASIGIRVLMGYLFVYAGYALLPALLVHTMFNFVPELLPNGYSDYHPLAFMPFVWLAVAIVTFGCYLRQSVDLH